MSAIGFMNENEDRKYLRTIGLLIVKIADPAQAAHCCQFSQIKSHARAILIIAP